jgi:hypothetical protein
MSRFRNQTFDGANSRPYGSAIEAFFKALFLKLTNMGVTKSNFLQVRPTVIKWPARTGPSVKEGNSGWRKINLRFVLLVGSSQSIKSLRGYAHLWIIKGGVRLVLVINIHKKSLKMTMEQWITSPESRASRQERVQQVRVQPNGKPTNINLETLEISPNAPLTLEFERLVGRPHNPPLEQDSFIFNEPDLKEFAQVVKDSIQDEIAMKKSVRNAILAKTSEAAGRDPSSRGQNEGATQIILNRRKRESKTEIILDIQK